MGWLVEEFLGCQQGEEESHNMAAMDSGKVNRIADRFDQKFGTL
jgi:hypothetical protein